MIINPNWCWLPLFACLLGNSDWAVAEAYGAESGTPAAAQQSDCHSAQATGVTDGPVVLATVLRTSREKSFGLNTQVAAFRVSKGKFLVRTEAVTRAVADFEIRFSWRMSKDTGPANAIPSMVANEVEPARKAILAAMAESYPEQAMGRVIVERPSSGKNSCWEVIFPEPRSGVSLARQFRVARKLVAARLAEMKLTSGGTGTWPAEFRPSKLLALYDAEGVGYYGSTLLDRAVNETTLDAQTVPVCGEDIREGILDRCKGVLFPGGTGKGIAAALRPEGVQRVREFVAKGGGYFGVCAGAYLATSGLPEYAGMIPLKHDLPWAKGSSLLKVGLTPEGIALLGAEFSHIETRYNCGPVYCNLAPNGQRVPVTVLANFQSPSKDSKGVVHQEMVGTPAIMSIPWQKGRIMIVSPHPESQSRHYPLVARAIAWAIGQDPKSVQARVPAMPNTKAGKPEESAER
jgi:hypothetical protein